MLAASAGPERSPSCSSPAWLYHCADLHMLRRFLKARNWDPQAARQMWLEMLQFRCGMC